MFNQLSKKLMRKKNSKNKYNNSNKIQMSNKKTNKVNHHCMYKVKAKDFRGKAKVDHNILLRCRCKLKTKEKINSNHYKKMKKKK